MHRLFVSVLICLGVFAALLSACAPATRAILLLALWKVISLRW